MRETKVWIFRDRELVPVALQKARIKQKPLSVPFNEGHVLKFYSQRDASRFFDTLTELRKHLGQSTDRN